PPPRRAKRSGAAPAARRRPHRLASGALSLALLFFVFLATAGLPVFARSDWSAPQQDVARLVAAFLASGAVLVAAVIGGLFTRIVTLGRFRPALWMSVACAGGLLVVVSHVLPVDVQT